MPETPEDRARREIDAGLTAAGWLVQDRDDIDLTASRGIAVRGFPMKPGFGFADYLLYLDRKAVREAGDKLSEDELLATCILLLVAGHETTVNLIGNGTLALLRHPGQLQRLREDPALIGCAVEELLRYDGPVQRTARIPSADVTIAGQTIPKGDMVMPFIGAADRDPAQFPDPDRLDIGRADNRHIAFGWGIHFCLGAPLARLEGQIAIGTLVQRLPKLALATDSPEHRLSLTLRGLTSLPVSF